MGIWWWRDLNEAGDTKCAARRRSYRTADGVAVLVAEEEACSDPAICVVESCFRKLGIIIVRKISGTRFVVDSETQPHEPSLNLSSSMKCHFDRFVSSNDF